MNPLRLIDEFLQRAAIDERLTPLHISLWVSIFHRWHAAGAQHPIRVTRLYLMQAGKIGSKKTYHRCIQELRNYGYILYQGSNHPIEGSIINLFHTPPPIDPTCIENDTTSHLVTCIESGTTSHLVTCTENDTSSKSDTTKSPKSYQKWYNLNSQVVPLMVQVNPKTPPKDNHPTDESMENKTKENSLRNRNTGYNPIDVPPNFCSKKEQKGSSTKSDTTKKTNEKSPIYNNNILDIYNIENIGEVVPKVIQVPEVVPKVVPLQPPELSQVTAFFSAQNRPKIEAEKFFNYYQSNGWRVGKNPMKNWQAAARNWMLNMNQFTPPTGTSSPIPGILQAPPIKDYSEPL